MIAGDFRGRSFTSLNAEAEFAGLANVTFVVRKLHFTCGVADHDLLGFLVLDNYRLLEQENDDAENGGREQARQENYDGDGHRFAPVLLTRLWI
jgi:hypothetical protein